ncbi:MAG: M24 family metallopeptidase, partial [Phocaeicola sp.]
IIDIDNNQEIIFEDDLTIDHIVWMGTQPTAKEKAALVGINKTLPVAELKKYLDKERAKGAAVHYLPPYRGEHSVKLLHLLGLAPEIQKEHVSVEFIMAVANMRNYKSEEEIIEIEKAANVSADMHIAAMKMARVGMYEYEVAAKIMEVAYSNNCELAFPIIATINGQTLHNHYHGNKMKEGDLLLIDAGASVASHYSGDLSSTCPVSKTFTAQQRMIMDIQVRSHRAAVAALKPGINFRDVHVTACRSIAEDMKALGLMKGNLDDAVVAGAHALFMPCGLGHMMGLDVHDMENLGEQYVGYGGEPKSTLFGYKSLRLGRPLESGFVLTIEPGVYFIPELIDLWKSEKRFADFLNYDEIEKYRNFGGLRNEEDYLITPNGARRLGKYVPMTPDEIEELRQGH